VSTNAATDNSSILQHPTTDYTDVFQLLTKATGLNDVLCKLWPFTSEVTTSSRDTNVNTIDNCELLLL